MFPRFPMVSFFVGLIKLIIGNHKKLANHAILICTRDIGIAGYNIV